MNISILGNCQIETYYRILEQVIPGCKVSLHPIHLLKPDEYEQTFKDIKKSDLTLTHPLTSKYGKLSTPYLKNKIKNITIIHNLYFRGQLTDSNYLLNRVQSPVGDYNSEIVYECYKNGISTSQCYESFRHRNHKERCLSAWKTSYFELLNREIEVDVPFAAEVNYLSKYQRTFHTINHPTIELISDYVIKILRFLKQPYEDLSKFKIEDPLLRDAIIPIFPEVVEHLHLELEPSNTYKKPTSLGGETISLEEYINGSYKCYDEQKLNNPTN